MLILSIVAVLLALAFLGLHLYGKRRNAKTKPDKDATTIMRAALQTNAPIPGTVLPFASGRAGDTSLMPVIKVGKHAG